MRNQSNKPVFAHHCERLEARQFLSATLGTNLVVNGDAEATTGGNGSAVDISPWVAKVERVTAVTYGVAGFPTANSPGPATRGLNFFAGGPADPNDANANTGIAQQTIDISSLAVDIDAGRIKYNLSAFVG